MIQASQIRAGRALLNIKQSELAKAAGISLATLNNIERGIADPRTSTLTAIETALNEAGVIVEEDGVHLSVSVQTISRVGSYDTFALSQKILNLLDAESLLKLEEIVFFFRKDSQAEAQTVLCCMLVGEVRAVLFDQQGFQAGNIARMAELAGTLLAAFSFGADKMHFIDRILDDTTIFTPAEAVKNLKQHSDKTRLFHPRQLLSVVWDYEDMLQSCSRSSQHPLTILHHMVSGRPTR